MSHIVKINTQFTSLEATLAAFRKLGWEIEEKAKAKTYPSDPKGNTVYDYVAKNPQKGYDIGIMVTDKEIELFADDYDRSIGQQLGNDKEKLKTEYILQVLEQEYEEYVIISQDAEGMIVEVDDGI